MDYIPPGYRLRTWDEVEAAYPTWGDINGKRWYTIMYGYLYSAPVIEETVIGPGYIGNGFTLSVKVTEGFTDEDGNNFVESENPYTGSVKASFLGKEYILTRSTSDGPFEGTVEGPSFSQWQSQGPMFEFSIIAENYNGSTTETHQITIHEATPVIRSIEPVESETGRQFTLRAVIDVDTTPELDGALFAGTLTADFQGTVYELTESPELGIWTTVLTAPDETSWHLPGHVYTGSLTALFAEETATADFSVRVRETVPPSIKQIYPLSDMFICNPCSPLFKWSVEDSDSGVRDVSVKLDWFTSELAEIRDGTAAWQMSVVGPGRHTITAVVTDNDENCTTVSTSINGIQLISDRTQADVDRLKSLGSRDWECLTAEEQGEYLYGRAEYVLDALGETLELDDGLLQLREGFNRGEYKAADLNRIETASAYIAKRLQEHRVSASITTDSSWTKERIPGAGDMSRCLGNLELLSSKYNNVYMRPNVLDIYDVFPEEIPPLPSSMAKLNFEGANRLEDNLVILERLIDWNDAVEWCRIYNRWRTWEDVERVFPTWNDIDGKLWIEIEYGDITREMLKAPWEKLPISE